MNKSEEQLIGPDEAKVTPKEPIKQAPKKEEAKVETKETAKTKVDTVKKEEKTAPKKAVQKAEFIVFRKIRGLVLGDSIAKGNLNNFSDLVDAGYIKKASELSSVQKIDLEERKTK